MRACFNRTYAKIFVRSALIPTTTPSGRYHCYSISQMRKLRHKYVKLTCQCRQISKRQSQDVNSKQVVSRTVNVTRLFTKSYDQVYVSFCPSRMYRTVIDALLHFSTIMPFPYDELRPQRITDISSHHTANMD